MAGRPRLRQANAGAIAAKRACLYRPGFGRYAVLTLYSYANCDTCRQAAKWLQACGLAFTERPIRETPPKLVELRTMLAAQGGELRKLFNTSGREYRAGKIGEKLPAMTEAAALALLAGNGFLVKRPFLIGESAGRKIALVGFDEAAWTAAGLPK